MTEERANDMSRLRGLLPLRHLVEAEFDALTRHLDVETLGYDQALFQLGADGDWLFYLLEGTVKIRDALGGSFEIQAGTLEALHPLSPHPKARVSGTALTPLRFVRVPSNLLSSQKRSVEGAGGIQVSEAESGDDALDSELLFAVYQALKDDTLVIPTLPEVALSIRSAAADPKRGADDIACIILTDPALASYTLRIANSAAYNGLEPVGDVKSAVMRIGIEATRDFILAHVVRHLFKSTGVRSNVLMRSAWSHSANTAALCYVLARRLTHVNPEQALLAGLLHDVGILALVSQIDAFPRLLQNETTLRMVLHDLRYQVSAMVLRAWRLPEQMVKASCAAEQWSRPIEQPYGLTEILQLAHWHEPDNNLAWAEPLPLGDAPVLAALPADAFTESGRLLVIREAGEELEKLRSLLSA